MSTRRGEAVVAVAVVAVFFALRFALLVVREPFIDEIWTVWLAKQPLANVLPALRVDSGPPLYYFLARIPDVFALRALSLLFATATLALVLLRTSLGTARWIAGALIAVYPPAALYAADARAYALCGLFVAAGVIALHEEKPFAGAGALLLAAYSHWYGALFLPLVLSGGQAILPVHLGQAGLPVLHRRRLLALAVASVLFIPGLVLASKQPAAAMAWMDAAPFDAFGALSFVRPYVASLFASPPLVLTVLAAVATLLAIARDFRFAPAVLVPVALALAFQAAGRQVYFPMRFEAVLAVPLALWIATSLLRWTKQVRVALLTVLLGCGLLTTVLGIVEHQRRPPEPYAQAAYVLRTFVQPSDRVVAIGHLYLHAVHELGGGRVTAYPAEQAVHPGWRVRKLTAEKLPDGPFLLAAERIAPELRSLRGRPVRVLYENSQAVILRVGSYHP